ncbi:hypothetical protein L2E82_32685 [Cichorium intybus]|uniref:Uncharacterized protein n=1 Tax=Cichorium intybus TaxID=13427 RepID=A0ACB9BIT3_CICIN|nr:hypothetical protein L2E82_32685 [Cichorium intybus]
MVDKLIGLLVFGELVVFSNFAFQSFLVSLLLHFWWLTGDANPLSDSLSAACPYSVSYYFTPIVTKSKIVEKNFDLSHGDQNDRSPVRHGDETHRNDETGDGEGRGG